jgi:uncharacterized Zn-finger protein
VKAHAKKKVYSCDVCEAKFYLKKNYADHLLKHSGKKTHCCDHCGKQFLLAANLQHHLQMHAGKLKWCTVGKHYKPANEVENKTCQSCKEGKPPPSSLRKRRKTKSWYNSRFDSWSYFYGFAIWPSILIFL